jgi:hypothetical protein
VLVPLFCRCVCLGAWAPIVHGVLVRQGGDVFFTQPRCLLLLISIGSDTGSGGGRPLHPAALSAPSHLDWIGHGIGRRPSSSSSRASCSASSRLGWGQPSLGTTKLGSERIDCLNICCFIAHRPTFFIQTLVYCDYMVSLLLGFNFHIQRYPVVFLLP